MKNRLKVLRAERDWTQEDLAQRLGVTRQAIIAIERGKYDPSLPLALRIGKLFSQPVEQIFLMDEKDSKVDDFSAPRD
ncbi:MAG TPA: helix-turn-helix transcriptional regulator [Acidobacteriota bacterium]|nr:helix-turn-helix transcriptional regulator [Acidobacteriota bacterium]